MNDNNIHSGTITSNKLFSFEMQYLCMATLHNKSESTYKISMGIANILRILRLTDYNKRFGI